METVIFYILLLALFIFVMWLGVKIIQKAGLDPRLVVFLLIPIVNIILIWVFAFTKWPNLKEDVKQGLNT